MTIVLGYLLVEIPNIELMTLSVFLSGIFLGIRLGVLVGSLSIFFYSVFNPFGPPLPPILIAQLAGFILVGMTGGLMGPFIRRGHRSAVIVSAASGLVLTLVYDLLTTGATALVALGLNGLLDGAVGFFLAGSLFIAIHTFSNTAIFVVAVVPIVRVAVARIDGG